MDTAATEPGYLPGPSLHRAGGDDKQDGDAAYQSLSGRYSPFS